jgi:hypothetical protein
MVDFLRRVAQAYGALGLAVQAAIVVTLAVVTTAVGIAMVVWIPPDHFKSDRPQPTSWWRSQPVLYGSVVVLKNAAGFVFLALGAVMALPLVPGPGLVFMLLGLSLLDFPGKRNMERRLLAIPAVIGFLNGVRARFRRPALVLDSPDRAPDRRSAS